VARILLVCLGGLIGTGARYGLNGLIAHRYGESFPVGTLAINVLGSFAIGVIFVATGPDSRVIVSAETRQFLMIGVLGGFTTFSSFSLQTLALLRDGEVAAAIANVTLSVVLGLLAAWAGEEAARGIWLSR
jgi:fluoride exporter